MDSRIAFAIGEANRDKELMVFDWDKAAKLIKERKPKQAAAGLRSDWEYTGGEIYSEGKPIPKEDTYTYLSSTWAVPELDMDGDVVDCFKMQSELPDWDNDTYWPESALKILSD
jgi:hypothetical protein